MSDDVTRCDAEAETDESYRQRVLDAYGMWGAFCTAVMESHGNDLDIAGATIGVHRNGVQVSLPVASSKPTLRDASTTFVKRVDELTPYIMADRHFAAIHGVEWCAGDWATERAAVLEAIAAGMQQVIVGAKAGRHNERGHQKSDAPVSGGRAR